MVIKCAFLMKCVIFAHFFTVKHILMWKICAPYETTSYNIKSRNLESYKLDWNLLLFLECVW